VFWVSVGVAVAIVVLAGPFGLIFFATNLLGNHGNSADQAADKYGGNNFADCSSFADRGPDIPSMARQVSRVFDPRVSDSGLLYCTFQTDDHGGPSVTFKADWQLTRSSESGSDKEESYFVGLVEGSGDGSPVGIEVGEQSHWLNDASAGSCALVVLDRNASFEVHYHAPGGGHSLEACRGSLRKVTQELFAAAQPR
jgi:hypothetical protein